MKAAKLYLCLFVLLPFAANSQAIEVKKETARIEGRNTTGYQVAIAATEEAVKNSLTKYLKALGKTRVSGDYLTLAEPLIGGKKILSTLYATTRGTGNTISAWIGIPSGDPEESAQEVDLKKLVYDFGVAFRREQIQARIDESLRALQAVERQHSRLLNQNKDLNTKIENNKREKIRLEKSLAENKVEMEALTARLEENRKAQDSVAVATEQIKKVVEMHRAKQMQVH
jgi:predicted RNase H-like nuclease (RuvC/YqgF family)